ncbi:MAG: hypothetical protein IPM16_00925 [Chloroflexi bacterium]|nr:hypothetical protein [Chloroflexota bacterium]
MVYKRFRVATGAIGLMCLCVGVVLLAATPSLYVSAQCGTQASSCLACHETQGQDPVNADGTGWHESHAFGDFCYICHAGNQQSMVKEEAHTGLVPPMEDVAASCQMCHASDLEARAAVYNTILASSTGGGTDTQPAAENDSADSFWGNEAAQPTAESADAFWGGGSEAAAPTAAPTTAPAAPAPTAAPAAVEEQEECPVPVNQLIVDDASD